MPGKISLITFPNLKLLTLVASLNNLFESHKEGSYEELLGCYSIICTSSIRASGLPKIGYPGPATLLRGLGPNVVFDFPLLRTLFKKEICVLCLLANLSLTNQPVHLDLFQCPPCWFNSAFFCYTTPITASHSVNSYLDSNPPSTPVPLSPPPNPPRRHRLSCHRSLYSA